MDKKETRHRAQGISSGRGQSDSREARRGSRFYDRVLTEEEIAALADLAASPTLSDEIALLKVLIRRKLEEGTDLATISKAVDALGRALKVQKQISDEGHRALQDALVAVLSDLGEQGLDDGAEKQDEDQKARNRRRRKDVVVR